MAFRSSNKASSSTGGTITAAPPGAAAHDYLGATYVVDSNTATVTVPSGWTNDTFNNWASGGPDGGRQFYAFKADASGADAFGFTDTNGATSNSVITGAWSGRDNASPHSTARVKTVNSTSNVSPISATITGITASANDDIAVWKATDQTVAGGRWTHSPITGYTERQDGVATDWVSGIALDTIDNVSAGATGNLATTITLTSGTGNAGYGGIVVAIKAAAGGATPYAANLSSATFQFSPQALTRLTTIVSALSSATFQFTGNAVARLTTVVNALSSATFQFSPQALSRVNAYAAQLGAATLALVPQALNFAVAAGAVVSDWIMRARRRRR